MKESLDILIVERRLVESRSKARWLIRNGFVLVDGKTNREPDKKIENSKTISLLSEFPYVGKGGLKLEAALREFQISADNKVCADLGASVGGFTDCLIQKGAKKVYAVDTATELLHPSLICEKMEGKVIPMLGIDARELIELPSKVDLCTIDITFSPLESILLNVKNFLKPEGDIIALVKPLFETDFYNEQKIENIVKNKDILYQILNNMQNWAIQQEIFPYNLILSPIKGKGGSLEFFFHFRIDHSSAFFNFKKRAHSLLFSE
ncbi:MAG: TlyA family RNA methyltransferase [Promethearchaeota archaeon]|nr:MAG: TlyA family RNA methyltransferase [Candidatus Lokiarchaeota archaeon]